jgi:hypothetical protein
MSLMRSPDGGAAGESFRGIAIAAPAGARTAEAIVPAIEPDDRYPERRPPRGYEHRGIEMSPKESPDREIRSRQSNRVAAGAVASGGVPER